MAFIIAVNPNDAAFVGRAGEEAFDLATGNLYRQQRNPSGTSWNLINKGQRLVKGEAEWGLISGSLSNQTDLYESLNSKVNLAGGTMTGLLKLSGDPVDLLGAVTKNYADNLVFNALALDSGKIFVGNGSDRAVGVDLSLNPTAGTFGLDNAGMLTVPDATGSGRGFLNAADWTTFNNKEPAITAGTTAQYWRGDKTFQDLGTAVRATALTGFSVGANSTILASDTILQAFGKTQGQINALPTGSGTTNRIAYWSGSSALGAVAAITAGYVNYADSNGLPTFDSTSSKQFFYDGVNHALILGGTTGIATGNRLYIPLATAASSGNYGLVSMGDKPFDGASTDFFTGSPAGTFIAINKSSTTSYFADWQIAGVSVFKVGNISDATKSFLVVNPSSAFPSINILSNGQVKIGRSSLTTASELLGIGNTGGAFSGTEWNTLIACKDSSGNILWRINKLGDHVMTLGGTAGGTTASGVQNAVSIEGDVWGATSVIGTALSLTSNLRINTANNVINGISVAPTIYNDSHRTGLTGYLYKGIVDATPFSASGASGTFYGMYLDVSGATNNYAIVVNNGRTGLLQTSPTAYLHLGSGTASANTAPLKFTSGTLLTTAEAGEVNYNSSFYATKNSGLRFGVGGKIYEYYTNAGNVTATGETDLYSSTTPASTLDNNGEGLEIEYGGNFVAQHLTDSRQIKAYFDGQTIFDSGTLTLSGNYDWVVYISIVRVSSSVIRYMSSLATEGATLSAYTQVGEITGRTLSGTNIIKITGNSAGTGSANNDIVAKIGKIMWVAAAAL